MPTTSRGYDKVLGGENARDYLKTRLAATLDLINADVVALLAANAAVHGVTNLLTNPGFEIWQRGAGPFTATGATSADRWMLVVSTSTVSISRESTNVDAGSLYAAAITYTHVGGGIVNLSQKVEDFSQLRGRTITFAARVKCSVAGRVRLRINDGVTNTDSAYNVGTGWETLSVTVAIPTTATIVSLLIQHNVGSCVTYVDNATLCVGTAAMAYSPLPAAADLLACQRYYQEIGGQNTTEFISVLQANSTVDAFGFIPLPVEMMATPTGTVSAAADWSVFQANGTAIACTAFTLVPTKRGSRLTITVASGLVAGNATAMRASATTNARLRFEANP